MQKKISDFTGPQTHIFDDKFTSDTASLKQDSEYLPKEAKNKVIIRKVENSSFRINKKISKGRKPLVGKEGV